MEIKRGTQLIENGTKRAIIEFVFTDQGDTSVKLFRTALMASQKDNSFGKQTA